MSGHERGRGESAEDAADLCERPRGWVLRGATVSGGCVSSMLAAADAAVASPGHRALHAAAIAERASSASSPYACPTFLGRLFSSRPRPEDAVGLRPRHAGAILDLAHRGAFDNEGEHRLVLHQVKGRCRVDRDASGVIDDCGRGIGLAGAERGLKAISTLSQAGTSVHLPAQDRHREVRKVAHTHWRRSGQCRPRTPSDSSVRAGQGRSGS